MAFQQVAKLYLRGSLCNITLKNLTQEQKDHLEEIIEMVVQDKNLSRCRIEFCNALKRTIRNEYEDMAVAEQDYRIAVMRAAVAALYGDNKPSSNVITDPTERKKWFQTWAFNYLRQILKENKLPSIKKTYKLRMPPFEAAVLEIKGILNTVVKLEEDLQHRSRLKAHVEACKIEEVGNRITFYINHLQFPIKLDNIIARLDDTYLIHGIEISSVKEGIRINRLADCEDIEITNSTKLLIRVTSFDGGDNNEDEDSRRDNLMLTAIPQYNATKQMEENEVIAQLRDSLPIEAIPVLNIYIEDTRPDQFTEKYGEGQPKIVHIAEFLNISSKEVKRLHSIIRMNILALGIGR